MTKIKYIFLKNINEINNINENSLISDLLLNYFSIIKKDINDYYFIYKGKKLSLKNKIKIKELNNKDISLFIFKKENEKKNKNEPLNHIICPKCEYLANLVLLNIEDDTIILDKCINKHKTIFNNLKDFINSQNINIKCNKCNNIISNYYDEIYYNSNDEYICSLCKYNENNVIEMIDKFYKCNKHNKEFISYCNDCNFNLCYDCEKNHKMHKIIYLKQIKLKENKIKEIKDNSIEFKNCINEYKKQINQLNILFNDIFNKIMNSIKEYIKLSEYISYSLNNLKNYESIKNISNLNIKKLIKDIHMFNNEENIIEKFKILLSKYEKIPKNNIEIIYKNNESKIRIFGEKFVKNNKDNCYIISYDKKYKIQEFFPIKTNYKNIKLNLIESRIIFDMNNMFSGCSSLSKLPNISKWNTENVVDMSWMFSNCSSLSSISDISKWNTNNVKDMSGMFSFCSSLSSLPDISKWNTNKVTNMSYMFSNCLKLSTLPDISKWNTNNVINMSYMFFLCSSLSSLPDISKWNTNNVKNMNLIFSGCKSTLYIPSQFKN